MKFFIGLFLSMHLLEATASEFQTTEYFLKADSASIHGDYKNSTEYFRRLTEIRPQDNYFKKRYAVELIRNGELLEAEKILNLLYITTLKKDDSLGLILAGLYLALELPLNALSIYQVIFNNGADIEEACLYLAKESARDEKYFEAHKLLEKCERQNKHNPVYAFYRGKIEYERGQKETAKIYLKHSLKVDHSFTQAALVLGNIYEKENKYKAAIKTYRDFLKIDENKSNSSILSRLEELLLNMKKN